MNFLRKNIANAFTLGNLFSGSIGIIHLLDGDYMITALCLVFSLLFDFLDGFVARAVRSDSNLGAQLDSLADMVTFGLLPGIVGYIALQPFGNQLATITLPFDISYFGLLIALFSCLRLAIFNLDDDQKYYFKGLNTPSNTILVFGLYFAYKENATFSLLFENEYLLFAFIIISSWLLISPLKMISFKFKSKRVQDNLPIVSLFVGCLALLAVFQITGIPLMIVYYILLSLIFKKTFQ